MTESGHRQMSDKLDLEDLREDTFGVVPSLA